jgi:hypothetical protein
MLPVAMAPARIVRGPGPPWLRVGLAGLAGLYFVALVVHPPHVSVLQTIGFFTESTCLFPNARGNLTEYRLDAWSCPRKHWEPLDPRPYFPIEPDNKESRFQRLAYFYQANRPTMQALDTWILARHDDEDDGVAGAIGGIKLSAWTRPIPEPSEGASRYHYRPLDPIPKDQRKDLFFTLGDVRRVRCGMRP